MYRGRRSGARGRMCRTRIAYGVRHPFQIGYRRSECGPYDIRRPRRRRLRRIRRADEARELGCDIHRDIGRVHGPVCREQHHEGDEQLFIRRSETGRIDIQQEGIGERGPLHAGFLGGHRRSGDRGRPPQSCVRKGRGYESPGSDGIPGFRSRKGGSGYRKRYDAASFRREGMLLSEAADRYRIGQSDQRIEECRGGQAGQGRETVRMRRRKAQEKDLRGQRRGHDVGQRDRSEHSRPRSRELCVRHVVHRLQSFPEGVFPQYGPSDTR